MIPVNKKFDMNELIVKIKKRCMQVGALPVSEKFWIDIGQLSEYKKNLDKFSF